MSSKATKKEMLSSLWNIIRWQGKRTSGESSESTSERIPWLIEAESISQVCPIDRSEFLRE